MPRKRKLQEAPRLVAGPRLAHEAARGAADFEVHLDDAGGDIFVVAIEWGRRERVIAENCSDITEALRVARRDPWWQQGGPVEVRSRVGDQVWFLDLDGCWDLAQGHEKGRAA